MKKTCFIIAFLATSIFVKAQERTIVPGANDTTIYVHVDNTPVFPGGMSTLYKFLNEKIQKGITSGKVFISFVVEKDGSLTNIKVVRGLSVQADAEAIRVMKLSPKWKPGIQNYRPVRVQYTIPIIFSMN